MAPQPGSFPPQPSSFTSPYRYSNVLPLGRWNLMINGRIYWLEIEAVNGGRVAGQLSGGTFKSGTWDGVGTGIRGGKLSFVRVEGDLEQQFEGWLLQYSEEDPLWRMAGTIEHLNSPEAGSGWYGTCPRHE